MKQPPDTHHATLVTLKQRWRALRRAVTSAERDALELAPALLSCSFDATGLKSDTPGVEGLRASPRYAALARKLGLPNLISQQTSQPQKARKRCDNDKFFQAIIGS